jgi:hypothetical protein
LGYLLLLLRLWVCGQRESVVQAQRHIHSRKEFTRDAVAPDRHRRPVLQRLMWAQEIIEAIQEAIPSFASRPSA